MEEQATRQQRIRRPIRVAREFLKMSTLDIEEFAAEMFATNPQLACMVSDAIAEKMGMTLAHPVDPIAARQPERSLSNGRVI